MKTYSKYFLCGQEIITCDNVAIASRAEGEINNAEFDIALEQGIKEVLSGKAHEDKDLPLL